MGPASGKGWIFARGRVCRGGCHVTLRLTATELLCVVADVKGGEQIGRFETVRVR